jgi:chaperonin GroEL (HSP60 family)
VTVAKSIEFKDSAKNLGASLVKQVANATNKTAGDGNSILLFLAITISVAAECFILFTSILFFNCIVMFCCLLLWFVM